MKISNNINIIWISLYQEKKTCCNEKTMILTLSDTIVSILELRKTIKKKWDKIWISTKNTKIYNLRLNFWQKKNRKEKF